VHGLKSIQLDYESPWNQLLITLAAETPDSNGSISEKVAKQWTRKILRSRPSEVKPGSSVEEVLAAARGRVTEVLKEQAWAVDVAYAALKEEGARVRDGINAIEDDDRQRLIASRQAWISER
jgi:hypothetical protein